MSEAIPSRWTFIRKSDRGGFSWFCCNCPAQTLREVQSGSVRSGKSLSCGCYATERRKAGVIHGASRNRRSSPEYSVWKVFKRRCYDSGFIGFCNYGGRGITVCQRWRNSFPAFLADMGKKPSQEHSIDRIRNDDGYWCGLADCPECGPAGREPNCRWATRKEQARNRRSTHYLTFNGLTQSVAAWTEQIGVGPGTILERIKRDWSVERALTTPISDKCRRGWQTRRGLIAPPDIESEGGHADPHAEGN